MRALERVRARRRWLLAGAVAGAAATAGLAYLAWRFHRCEVSLPGGLGLSNLDRA